MVKTKTAKGPSLPKHAPKRTGKRGIKPLDPDEDFNRPTKREPEQAQLLEVPATDRVSVEHGKMAVHFVRFVPDHSKDRNRVVFLDFSLELEDAHKGRLPKEIQDAWEDLKRGSIKRVDPDGVGPQNISLGLVSRDTDLEVVAAVSKASISRVTQKGKGKTRKVTRLQIRFLTAYTKDVQHFCQNAYDETTWIEMKASQKSFGDEEGEE